MNTKICKYCRKEVDPSASKCPHCHSDLRSWFERHTLFTCLLVLFLIFFLFQKYDNYLQKQKETQKFKKNIETHYQVALKMAAEKKWYKAYELLKKIHSIDPKYKETEKYFEISKKSYEKSHAKAIAAQKASEQKQKKETEKENQKKRAKYQKFFNELIETGLIFKYDLELHSLYIYEEKWFSLNIDQKKNITGAFADWCGASVGSARANVYGARSGKKLAYYGAWGFKVY